MQVEITMHHSFGLILSLSFLATACGMSPSSKTSADSIKYVTFSEKDLGSWTVADLSLGTELIVKSKMEVPGGIKTSIPNSKQVGTKFSTYCPLDLLVDFVPAKEDRYQTYRTIPEGTRLVVQKVTPGFDTIWTTPEHGKSEKTLSIDLVSKRSATPFTLMISKGVPSLLCFEEFLGVEIVALAIEP
jgi:hypothetical protein